MTSGKLHKCPADEHERMNSELRRGIYLSHRYGGTQRLVNRLEHRLVASLLRRLPRPLRILDIPSGYGRFTPQLEDAAATPLVCSDVDHRRLAVLGPREFKRLLQTLGCRVLADRAILPGLHAQRVALVEKVNSSGAAPGNSVPPTPLDPSPGAIALLPRPLPGRLRRPPSGSGRRASTAPHERRSGRGWAARRQGK